MDAGALGRSQIPSKVDYNATQGAAAGSGPESVNDAAGKSVAPVESENNGPALDDNREKQRETRDVGLTQAKVDRRTVIDSETETLLFQMIEKSTGEVKRQIPDDVLLNVREYAREVTEKSADAEPLVKETASA